MSWFFDKIAASGWTIGSITRDLWEEKFSRTPDLEVKISLNYGHKLKRYIAERTAKGNIVASIRGNTGTGKSWAGLAMGDYINRKHYKTRNALRWFFLPQDALNELPNMEMPNTMQLDEQLQQWGGGKQRIADEMKNLEDAIRKKKLSLIYASPSVRPHEHHFILETLALNEHKQQSMLIVYAPNEVVLGHIRLKAPPPEIWTQYEKDKDEFLDKVQKRESGTSASVDKEKMARELADDPGFEACTNKAQRCVYVERKFKTGQQEAYDIAELVEILKREAFLPKPSAKVPSPPDTLKSGSKDSAGSRRKR